MCCSFAVPSCCRIQLLEANGSATPDVKILCLCHPEGLTSSTRILL